MYSASAIEDHGQTHQPNRAAKRPFLLRREAMKEPTGRHYSIPIETVFLPAAASFLFGIEGRRPNGFLGLS